MNPQSHKNTIDPVFKRLLSLQVPEQNSTQQVLRTRGICKKEEDIKLIILLRQDDRKRSE